MNVDDSGEQEPPPDEEKKSKDANVGDGQGSSKEGELKVNGMIDIGGSTGQGSLQSQNYEQQSQGTPFCWERFLHIRTIKVLLVEFDDSTRHVVAALLRKCNYEVIEASNGLQAWKVLEDLTNHVDLILSEVVTPCVSGVGLLCKIMSHKSRKNIPIIMMSSHDSMGLVFKCLSKGAVDFLVKPIRKNELKNLWQHVWRRCHSSSGSGSNSESGSQTQKSIKSKSSEKSDNHSCSNDKEDDGSDGLNIGYGSDDGSGAQSSWTKQHKEVESSQETSQGDGAPECEDSTCAQVIYSNAEAETMKQFQATSAGNCLQLLQPEFHGLMACKSVNLEVKADAIEAASYHISAQQNLPLEIDHNIDGNMERNSLKFPNGQYQSNNDRVVCTTPSGPDIKFNRSGTFLEHTDRQDKMNNAELAFRNLAADAPHGAKSNVPGGPGKASPLNYSLEQSASGSNYGSNGHNGSGNAVNAGAANGESDTGINLKSGNVNSSGSGNRLYENGLAQREAALAKFRQKRKERCSEKQVRYKNRKRLAEMRPHVQGQFVRQIEQDGYSSYEADEQ